MKSARALAAIILTAPAAASGQVAPVFGAPGNQTPVGIWRFSGQVRGADVTGDGLIDAVVADIEGRIPPYFSRFHVFPRLRGGGFGPPITSAVRSAQGPFELYRTDAALALGDLNQDGFADLVTSQAPDSFGNSPNIAVLFGRADGRFAGQIDLTNSTTDVFMVPPRLRGIAVADVDSDGRLDIASTASFQLISVMRGDGAGGFAPPILSGNARTGAEIVLVGDVNADGMPDVVTLTRTGSGSTANTDVQVNLGDGAGRFSQSQAFSIDLNLGRFRAAHLGRFDSGGGMGLAVHGYLGSQRGRGGLAVYRSVGGTLTEIIRESQLEHPNVVDIAVADFNADGVDELI